MPGSLTEMAARPRRGVDSYRELCEFLPWGYVVVDHATRIEEANAAAARLLGRSHEHLRGAALQAFLADGSAATLLDTLAQCAASRAPRRCTLAVAHPGGDARHVEVHVQSTRHGDEPRYRMALRDATDVPAATLALRQVADEMRDLYQNAPCGYHSLDAQGVVIQINDTELRWLGYRRDEIVRRVKLTDLMPARWRPQFDAAFAALKQRGQVRDLELEFLRRDGTPFPVLLSATALPGADRSFRESRASMFDITRRRRAEEEARRYAQRLKGMSRRVAEVQEAERRTLAQELHDRVGQNLTALSINLNILSRALDPATTAAARMRLDDSLQLVDRTVESIRDVMTDLRPAVLDDYGLAAMLRSYADAFSRRTGVSVGVSGSDPAPRLAPAVERTLFRIVQESLNNVAKHAHARQVSLQLEPGTQRFRLCVVDDGCGFDPLAAGRANNHHWGLMIMRERAESAGGQLRVEAAPGEGTRVVVDVRV